MTIRIRTKTRQDMSYIWNLPTKVMFGAGMVKELGKQEMPGKRALLVISNGKSARTNGGLDIVSEELRRAGVEVTLFDKICANPTVPILTEGINAARANHCDFIVGLGGGSVLDAVTVIAAVAPQEEGGVWDYIQGGTGGKKPLRQKSLPYIEITTSAGTGSEVDRWGVVTNPDTHEKIGFEGDYAQIAVVDPELMLTVPPAFTAYQGFDALFHSVEGFVSKCCNEAAEMVEMAAIENIARYMPIAVHEGHNLEARTMMAFANTMSGYSMELSSCTSEHSMEHAMSGHHQELPHGAGLIMISKAYFTKWIEQHVCDDRFVTMAVAMGKKDATRPMDFIDALCSLQQSCGVDQLRMSDYGISPSEFPTLARDAKATMGGLFACDRFGMSDEEVAAIYQASYK